MAVYLVASTLFALLLASASIIYAFALSLSYTLFFSSATHSLLFPQRRQFVFLCTPAHTTIMKLHNLCRLWWVLYVQQHWYSSTPVWKQVESVAARLLFPPSLARKPSK